MGSQCYVVTDTADGLSDGGRIGCIWLGCEVALLPAGVITAQINGHGTSHENVSLGLGCNGRGCRGLRSNSMCISIYFIRPRTPIQPWRGIVIIYTYDLGAAGCQAGDSMDESSTATLVALTMLDWTKPMLDTTVLPPMSSLRRPRTKGVLLLPV